MATLKERRNDILQQLLISQGTEEGGHSPYTPWKPAPGGPYVPAPERPKRDGMTISSTPQGGGYPTTPSYINYKEIRDVNPYLIDKFIKDRGLKIFEFKTGIPLAQNLEDGGGGWKYWNDETKREFLINTDEEYKQWLKDNNFLEEDEPDIKKQKNKLGRLTIKDA